jgi:hypothetical protein
MSCTANAVHRIEHAPGAAAPRLIVVVGRLGPRRRAVGWSSRDDDDSRKNDGSRPRKVATEWAPAGLTTGAFRA